MGTCCWTRTVSVSQFGVNEQLKLSGHTLKLNSIQLLPVATYNAADCRTHELLAWWEEESGEWSVVEWETCWPIGFCV